MSSRHISRRVYDINVCRAEHDRMIRGTRFKPTLSKLSSLAKDDGTLLITKTSKHDQGFPCVILLSTAGRSTLGSNTE